MCEVERLQAIMDRIRQFIQKYSALILVFLICLGIRVCLDWYRSAQNAQPEVAPEVTTAPAPAEAPEIDESDNFVAGVPGTTYNRDGSLYAEQAVKAGEDGVNRVWVTVYAAETGLPAAEFDVGTALDYRGIRWDGESDDIWVKSAEAGVRRMRYEDGKWMEE